MARILLAEDTPATSDMVKHALTSDGHEVVVAGDGSEALERLAAPASHFDLMITDVQMPGLDGIALIEKAFQIRPDIGIILMSGFAGGLERAEGLKDRVRGILSKPFTLEQIKAAVRTALK